MIQLNSYRMPSKFKLGLENCEKNATNEFACIRIRALPLFGLTWGYFSTFACEHVS